MRVENDQELCADMVVLTYNNKNDNVYIETSNLDGEKTLKPKQSIFSKAQTPE